MVKNHSKDEENFVLKIPFWKLLGFLTFALLGFLNQEVTFAGIQKS